MTRRQASATDETYRVAVIVENTYTNGTELNVYGYVVGPYTTKGPATSARNKEIKGSHDIHEFVKDKAGNFVRDSRGYTEKKVIGYSRKTAVLQRATGWENVE